MRKSDPNFNASGRTWVTGESKLSNDCCPFQRLHLSLHSWKGGCRKCHANIYIIISHYIIQKPSQSKPTKKHLWHGTAMKNMLKNNCHDAMVIRGHCKGWHLFNLEGCNLRSIPPNQPGGSGGRQQSAEEIAAPWHRITHMESCGLHWSRIGPY